jgi:hypothetical protein
VASLRSRVSPSRASRIFIDLDPAMSLLLLVLGGAVCVCNLCLSLRRPFLYWMGRPTGRFISGIPVLGSALVALACFVGLESLGARITAGLLVLVDTGGLHWFFAVMAWQAWTSRVREKP